MLHQCLFEILRVSGDVRAIAGAGARAAAIGRALLRTLALSATALTGAGLPGALLASARLTGALLTLALATLAGRALLRARAIAGAVTLAFTEALAAARRQPSYRPSIGSKTKKYASTTMPRMMR